MCACVVCVCVGGGGGGRWMCCLLEPEMHPFKSTMKDCDITTPVDLCQLKQNKLNLKAKLKADEELTTICQIFGV